MKLPIPLLLALIASPALADEQAPTYTFADVHYMETVTWRPKRLPEARILYGDSNPLHFADLRLPSSPPPAGGYPVIVFVHGGAWLSDWSKDHTEPFAEALTEQGFATWDLEFRRIGNRSGGYPGTFEDIADATDYLRTVAETYPLNLDQVIASGHSSGGHLALWLGGREQLPESSPLYREDPLPLAGIISIAGVNDLELSLELGDRTDVLTLSGIESAESESGATRFAETNPSRLRPFGIPQTMMIGDKDSKWRLAMTKRDAEHAEASGDATRHIIVPGANHMDVMDPRSGFAEGVAIEARRILELE